MGFLSKITKPFKKIWKGVKKVAKKAWKGVKKFAKSKIGKLIIAAVVIYFTAGAGMAMLGGAAPAAGAAGTTVAGGMTGAASTALTGSAVTAGSAAIPAAMAVPSTLAATGAGAGAAAAGGGGLISSIGSGLSSAGTWMAANPMPTMMAGQMLSSAFTPSAAEEQAEIDAERRKRSNIAGVYGDATGSPISLGLVQQAQQQDLRAPTYSFKQGG